MLQSIENQALTPENVHIELVLLNFATGWIKCTHYVSELQELQLVSLYDTVITKNNQVHYFKNKLQSTYLIGEMFVRDFFFCKNDKLRVNFQNINYRRFLISFKQKISGALMVLKIENALSSHLFSLLLWPLLCLIFVKRSPCFALITAEKWKCSSSLLTARPNR